MQFIKKHSNKLWYSAIVLLIISIILSFETDYAIFRYTTSFGIICFMVIAEVMSCRDNRPKRSD